MAQADKDGRLEPPGAAAQIGEHSTTSPIAPIFQLRKLRSKADLQVTLSTATEAQIS